MGHSGNPPTGNPPTGNPPTGNPPTGLAQHATQRSPAEAPADNGRQVVLFSKYWQAGQVKTRLAADVGSVAAAELHRSFLQCLFVRLARCGDVRTCAGWPPERLDAFAELATRSGVGRQWNFAAQPPGDLGTRLKHVVERARAAARRVVIVGSDSPNLPVADVDRALDLLTRVSVVVGPATDGGYWLLGVHGLVPPIFDGMSWGGGDVLRETIHRLERASVAYRCLARWYDVDTLDDLVRLVDDLQTPSSRTPEPALVHLLARIQSRVAAADLRRRG